jgi:hypothetical protein
MDLGVRSVDANLFIVKTLDELLSDYRINCDGITQFWFDDKTGSLSEIRIIYKNLSCIEQLKALDYSRLKEDLYSIATQVNNKYGVNIKYICEDSKIRSELPNKFMYSIEVIPSESEVAVRLLEILGIKPN